MINLFVLRILTVNGFARDYSLSLIIRYKKSIVARTLYKILNDKNNTHTHTYTYMICNDRSFISHYQR